MHQSSGGKLIHCHGKSDNSASAASSVIYQDSVRKSMYPNLEFREGYDKLNEWYRIFLIPRASHCSPSSAQPGPFPADVVRSLISWVEEGVNPTLLNATVTSGPEVVMSQGLCSWPSRPFGANLLCVYDQVSVDS